MERGKPGALRSLTWYAGSDFLGKAIGFLVSPLLTRLLTPHQYGVPALLASVWTVLALVQFGGMDWSFPFFRSHARERKDLSGILSTSTVIALGSLSATILLFSAAAFLWGGVRSYIGFASGREMLAGIVATGAVAALSWLLYLLRFQQKAHAFALAGTVGNVLGAVLFVAVAFFFPQEERLEVRFWTYALFAVAGGLLAFRLIGRGEEGPVRLDSFDPALGRRMALYGAVLVPGGLLYAVFTAVDRLLLGWFDPPEVAVLAIALTLAGAALMMRGWFSLVWSPVVTEWIAERDTADYTPRLDRLFRAMTVTGFPLVLLGSIWVRPFLELIYPPFYARAAGPIILLLLAGSFSILSLVANVSTLIARIARYHTPVYGIALILNIACGIIFIPRLGALGAVIGTATGELVILVLWIVVTNHVLKRNHLSWGPGAVIMAPSTAASLLFLPSMPLGDAGLAVRAACSVTVAALLAILLGRRRKELLSLWNVLQRKG